jgi:hypothetical protein
MVAVAAGAAVELPPHAARMMANALADAINVKVRSLPNCVSPPDVVVLLGTIILGAHPSNPQAQSRFSR